MMEASQPGNRISTDTDTPRDVTVELLKSKQDVTKSKHLRCCRRKMDTFKGTVIGLPADMHSMASLNVEKRTASLESYTQQYPAEWKVNTDKSIQTGTEGTPQVEETAWVEMQEGRNGVRRVNTWCTHINSGAKAHATQRRGRASAAGTWRVAGEALSPIRLLCVEEAHCKL